MKIKKLVQAEGTENIGHGHVLTRPDGVRMRCGGPGMCAECSKDLEKLQTFLRDDVSAVTERNDG